MNLKNSLNKKLNDKAEKFISSFLKPMADTMLKTAYDLTEKKKSYEEYSKEFYALYKINYAKRKEKQ